MSDPRKRRTNSTSELRIRLPALEQFLIRSGSSLADHPVPLSPRHIALAQPVFGAALAYERIRIVNGWVAHAPTTLGDTIRIDHTADLDDATLMHELTHVWQYQTRGPSYLSNSLCAQLGSYVRRGNRFDAYALTNAEIEHATSIFALSAERQAMFVQMFFSEVHMREAPQWQELIAQLQATRPLPPGFFDTEPFDAARVTPEDAAGDPRASHVFPSLSFEF